MTERTLDGRRILLIIPGGIAAYKCLDLIRLLRAQGAEVPAILTAGGAKFVTALSISALSEAKVYTDLHSLTDEHEMGHIRLSREADLVVVAPASADLLAKMAAGLGGDLASAVLLATDKPVLAAPAMNVKMWKHPATQRNVAQLADDGIAFVGPGTGELADGEWGPGRMAEPAQLLAAIESHLAGTPVAPAGSVVGIRTLVGKTALVTSGPTFEPIDPVRYLGSTSSGKQGHAIAAALAAAGAKTVLVSGPTAEPEPAGVTVHRVKTAAEMLAACEAAMPADVVVCAAAVSDWRVDDRRAAKIKKGANAPVLTLVENPDVLASLARAGPNRPQLVIGFAAETEADPAALIALATAKRAAKGCDWILANDVSAGTQTMGGERNTVHLVTGSGPESWPEMKKTGVADRLAARIASHLAARAPAA